MRKVLSEHVVGSDRACDRLLYQMRVPNGRQRHPVHAVRKPLGGFRGDLNGEPSFARATRAEQGHQSMRTEQLADHLKLIYPTDKPGLLDRKTHRGNPY